jgi:hypothetical protein
MSTQTTSVEEKLKKFEKYKVNNSKVEQLLNDKTYLYNHNFLFSISLVGGAFYLGINIYNKMFSN